MKVGMIGGTGTMGRALATAFSNQHEVLLGSRDRRRAESEAEKLKRAGSDRVTGASDLEVSRRCDLAILSIPDLEDAGFLGALRKALAGKIVVSPVVPMRAENGLMVYGKSSGSAAEEIASVLKDSRVVAALHHVPALTLLRRGRVDCDVLVACDKEVYEDASGLVRSIDGLRPIYVGPLSMARTVESITPLLLNAAKLNKMKLPSIRLVG